MFDSWHNSSGALDETAAGRLAARLTDAAGFWARQFLDCVEREDAALLSALANEVLAYGLCLLDLRLSTTSPEHARPFLGHLRRQCRLIRDQDRRFPAGQSLPAGSLDTEPSDFAQRYLAAVGQSYRDFQFTEALWREFCQTTGMDSPVLVGAGANLASLVFQIVVHGRVFSNGPACRNRMQHLLREASDCGRFFETRFDAWLADVPALPAPERRPVPDQSSLPGTTGSAPSASLPPGS
jgi:hypothetical protein